MKLMAKELIKTLLLQKGVKQKDLVSKLSEITGHKYTPSSFSHKVGNGSISYNEVLLISEILGYEIDFKNIQNSLV